MICDQTEEAAGVWGKIQHFRHLWCGGFSCTNDNQSQIKVYHQAGWVRHCVVAEPVIIFASRAVHFCGAAADQAQLTLSTLLSVQMPSELQNAATLT